MITIGVKRGKNKTRTNIPCIQYFRSGPCYQLLYLDIHVAQITYDAVLPWVCLLYTDIASGSRFLLHHPKSPSVNKTPTYTGVQYGCINTISMTLI